MNQLDIAGNYLSGLQGPQNALAQPQEQSQQYNALAAFGRPTQAAADSMESSPVSDAAERLGATKTASGGVILDGVDPRLRAVIEDAMAEAGEGWRITEGIRTKERQQQLYAQGRTAPGPVVTNTMNSQHLTGNALDVALIEGGKANWDFDRYRQFNDIVQRIASDRGVPVTWGGNWKMRDGPHFQLG